MNAEVLQNSIGKTIRKITAVDNIVREKEQQGWANHQKTNEMRTTA